MDPITQGLLGGVVAQALAKREHARAALFCGIAGGMAADLDVLIRSENDPLLFVEYHRHFTHSLAFVPIGGLLVALLLSLFLRHRLSFKQLYLYSTLGYATHGLLDACTTYGTHLLWPFSNVRASWDFISIIDPVFSGILLIFVIWSLCKRSARAARNGLALGLMYLALCASQHQRAVADLHALASERGHSVERYAVMPTLGNIVLWRGIYEYDGRLYVDAIYRSVFGSHHIIPGDSVKTLNLARYDVIPGVQRQDIERFLVFSNGFASTVSSDGLTIADMRYAALPQSTQPLWAIRLQPQSLDAHVAWLNFSENRRRQWREFVDLVNGAQESATQ